MNLLLSRIHVEGLLGAGLGQLSRQLVLVTELIYEYFMTCVCAHDTVDYNVELRTKNCDKIQRG